jgi:amino acid adenylation domain-containing protein/non-ribosomal peptide synthase protein (TIGR01720 family)
MDTIILDEQVMLNSRYFLESKEYWINYLKEHLAHEPIALFTPDAGEAGTSSYNYRLQPSLSKMVLNRCNGNDLSVLIYTMTAYCILMHKYTGAPSVGITVPVFSKEWNDHPNQFNEFLPIICQVNGGSTFKGLLKATTIQLLSAIRHQHYPLDRVYAELNLDGAVNVFDTALVCKTIQLEPDPSTMPAPLALYIRIGVEDICMDLHVPTEAPFSADQLFTDLQQIIASSFEDADREVQHIGILENEWERNRILQWSGSNTAGGRGFSFIRHLSEQLKEHAEKTAVFYEGREISYFELGRLASRLSCYLRTKAALKAGDRVVVLLDRTEWIPISLVSLLGSGYVYVPVDSGYPADRIRFVLEDLRPSLVLLEERFVSLAKSLNIPHLTIDMLQSQPDHCLCSFTGVIQDAGHEAYILYTSGSSGTPKGVIATHGNLDHFFGQVVHDYCAEAPLSLPFIASNAFDISLFQLMTPLASGGVSIIAGKDQLQDMQVFHSLLAKATAIDAVPALYHSLLEYRESQGLKQQWPGIKRVFIGGDSIPADLLCRLSTVFAHAVITVTYGPTEGTIFCTYRDYAPVALPRASNGSIIGRPLPGSIVYILGSDRQLLPRGWDGELCIGGASVTKGYYGLPELTSEKYIPDPYNPGALLYRSGDRGRWTADGYIEFRGRIDNQVKIRGHRVELTEIEHVLMQSGRVKQGVVLAKKDDNGNNGLMGYVVPEGPFDRESIVGFLLGRLPEYMVPQKWVKLEAMPLTANGKLDKKTLLQLEPDTSPGQDFVAPRTEVEQTLAGIWQDLLGEDRIGMNDNFFALGGDSIITIQMVSRARKAGHDIQPRDIFLYQSVGGLAKALSARTGSAAVSGAEQGLLMGAAGLLPIQANYLHKSGLQVSHFNQTVLLKIEKQVDGPMLEQAARQLVEHHDSLRFVFRHGEHGWFQEYGPYPGGIVVTEEVFPDQGPGLPALIRERCDHYQRSLDIRQGILIRMVLLETPAWERHNRLFIVIHHLVVDGVSWRILLEDLEMLLNGIRNKETLSLGGKSSSYRQWHSALEQYGKTRRLLDQQTWWIDSFRSYKPLPADRSDHLPTRLKDMVSCTMRLGRVLTQELLQDVPKAYHTEINDILLSALAKTLGGWSGEKTIVIGLEGHGRETIDSQTDLNRTVGWFASPYPVLLHTDATARDGDLIKSTKEQLRRIPDKGVGYGVLKYMVGDKALEGKDPWDIVFNYLGQSDNVVGKSEWVTPAEEPTGESVHAEYRVDARLVVNGMIRGGDLVCNWIYSPDYYTAETTEWLAESFMQNLEGLIRHCVQQGNEGAEHTPSDFGLANEISYQELDAFLGQHVGNSRRKDRLEGIYRLSGMQEGMLFHGLYDQQGEAYVEQLSSTIANLDEEALHKSWAVVLQRHSILRSGFYYDVFSIPVQCVYREASIPISVADFRSVGPELQPEAVQAFAEADRRRGFDLQKAPLMRISLLRLDEQRYRMIWTHHHMILDGWSLQTLMKELLLAYEAFTSGQPFEVGEEDRYEDYIRYLEHRNKEQEEQHWRTYLAGVNGAVLLPFIATTRERNKGIGEYRQLTLVIPPDRTREAIAIAQQHRLTMNTIVQGVWAYLLYRYTGDPEVMFGVTVSGRPEDLPHVESRVGNYINTIPFHVLVDGEQEIVAWLESIQEREAASREYQYTRLADIQKWTGIQGDLFDTLLLFENFPVSNVVSARPWTMKVADVVAHDQNNYPLALSISIGDEIVIQFKYNSDLLEETYVEMIRTHFERTLEQITRQAAIKSRTKELSWMGAAEQERLLFVFNPAAIKNVEDKTVHGLVEQQAARTPDTIALVWGDQELTYQQLDQRSNQLAHWLRGRGVNEECLVAICMDRSIEMIIGILGVLKAGGAYVPIDPEYPEERIGWMLADTRASVVLSSGACISRIPAAEHREILALDYEWAMIGKEPLTPPEGKPAGHHLAYVIYTSGSTGRPKGVMIEHRSLVNFLTGMTRELGLWEGSAFLSITTYTFDIFYLECFLPLVTGARMILASRETAADGNKLRKAIADYRPTHLQATPSGWKMLLDGGWENQEEVNMLCGGEALKEDLKKTLVGLGNAWNLYGPTETTIWSTCKRLRAGETSSIGRPIQNTRVYITDRNTELVPIGVKGSLCIGGDGLARGYLNQPELTDERFIPDPFIGNGDNRLYQTGDLARWDPDGEIGYLGRSDDQIKIRGRRIELGEVENVLAECPAVSRGAVLAAADASGDQRLIGYVVPEGKFDREEIRRFLQSRLPDYMIPTVMVELQDIPLTSNGKINKKALPAVEAGDVRSTRYTAPGTETEKKLAAIWEGLLGIERVGAADNFFELGGNSLLTTRLVAAIKRDFNLLLPMRLLFEVNTIAGLARYLELEAPMEPGRADEPAAFSVVTI